MLKERDIEFSLASLYNFFTEIIANNKYFLQKIFLEVEVAPGRLELPFSVSKTDVLPLNERANK